MRDMDTKTETEQRCDRCGREAAGWPLRRRDICSPTSWARCIREPEAIQRSLAAKREAFLLRNGIEAVR